MFAEITKYEKQTTLIMNSGLQFMDFAANFAIKGASGAFADPSSAGPLVRLEENEKNRAVLSAAGSLEHHDT